MSWVYIYKGRGTRDGSVLIKGVYNTSMDRYDEQLCKTCGSSSESLRYQTPPHSVKTSAKFCPDCGAIMPNATINESPSSKDKRMIEVVAAVIYLGNKILCFKRGASKFDYVSFKYEFPGGKLEAAESPEDALKRELYEELGLFVTVGRKLTTVFHEYPDFSIHMHCYLCVTDKFNGDLTDHVEYAEVEPRDLDQLDWIEADKPIVRLLMDGDR